MNRGPVHAGQCVLKEASLHGPSASGQWPSSQRGLLQSQSLLGGQGSPRWWRQSWESLFISECQHLGLARLLERGQFPGRDPTADLTGGKQITWVWQGLGPQGAGREGVDGHGGC